MIGEIKHYLAELGFSRNESAVYLALAKLGEAKAAQIAKAAELPRTTAISLLNKLKDDGYITAHVYRGAVSYWIESPQVLVDSLNARLDLARKLQESLPDLYHSAGRFPSADFFDTRKGIKSFMEKLLNGLAKGSLIYTIDTPNEGNYSKIFSEGVGGAVLAIKKQRNITTHTLVPHGSYATIARPKLSRQNIIVRELPPGLSFQSSLWLAGDTLVNFSGNPPFLAAIKQQAIVAGLKGIYDFLWSISEPVGD